MKAFVNVVAALFLLVGVTRAAGADFDVAKVNALSKADKVALVIAALQTRNASVRNMSVQITDHHIMMNQGEGKKGIQLSSAKYQIKLFDKSILMESVNTITDPKLPTVHVQESKALWDDSVFKTYGREGTAQACTVQSNVTGYVYGFSYFDMLGLMKTSWKVRPVRGIVTTDVLV